MPSNLPSSSDYTVALKSPLGSSSLEAKKDILRRISLQLNLAESELSTSHRVVSSSLEPPCLPTRKESRGPVAIAEEDEEAEISLEPTLSPIGSLSERYYPLIDGCPIEDLSNPPALPERMKSLDLDDYEELEA